MNKILAYTFLAILLGTVTMIAPLALLEPPEQHMLTTADNSNITALSPQKDTLGAEGTETAPELPTPAPSSPDFSAQAPESASPEEPSENARIYSISTESELLSGLSSIGLMIVPSFLIAVGVFVYLKKRV
jgi:hypothetical protein